MGEKENGKKAGKKGDFEPNRALPRTTQKVLNTGLNDRAGVLGVGERWSDPRRTGRGEGGEKVGGGGYGYLSNWGGGSK